MLHHGSTADPATESATASAHALSSGPTPKIRRYQREPNTKSTVTAGAAVLHLASKNKLPGFLIDSTVEADQRPIYGLYQDTEPHIARSNELFRQGQTSAPFVYTHGMRIGFRNVDSEEMEGSPLFEVRPAGGAVLGDPATGMCSLDFADFQRRWSGHLLLLSKPS